VRRRALVPIAVVGTGLLAGLLIAEAVVRMLHLAPDVGFVEVGRYRLSADPRLGYEMVPHRARPGPALDQYHFTSRSNSLGFRDREHPLRKRPGTYRILVLGDSIAEGMLVEDDRSIFPVVLEERLRTRGVAAEVLNFSVTGYNTMQEVETLKHRGLDYDPDLVLLAYCLNDTERVDGGLMQALEERERSSGRHLLNAARLNPWLARSALYRLVRTRVFPPAPALAADDRLDRDTVAEELDELAYLARAHRFEVLVAIFPRFDSLVPYPFGDQHAVIRRLASEHGFAWVDLLHAFQRCALADREPVAVDTVHPSVSGHACAAAAIDEAIARLASAPHPGTPGPRPGGTVTRAGAATTAPD
jgi:lysophospholipase L1-like esterase